ncbi:MAG: hypothetical protein JNJ80_06825 [Gemmatimonadetes bacterium]|nr:hypothetical protein [Gemmatimonadota bacterium]MCC7132684.1 hypothetical protein [Gemmatimonadales bacterium]
MTGYNFTDNVRAILHAARQESDRLRHGYVGTEHLLLGLLQVTHSVADEVLNNLAVPVDAVLADLGKAVPPGAEARAVGSDLPYTSRAKKVLELAMREASQLGHSYVGSEHLLLGLAREEIGIAAQVLTAHGATVDRLRAEVLKVLDANKAAASAARQPPEKREAGALPLAVTIVAEYPGGRLAAAKVTTLNEAIRHIWQLMTGDQR